MATRILKLHICLAFAACIVFLLDSTNIDQMIGSGRWLWESSGWGNLVHYFIHAFIHPFAHLMKIY